MPPVATKSSTEGFIQPQLSFRGEAARGAFYHIRAILADIESVPLTVVDRGAIGARVTFKIRASR